MCFNQLINLLKEYIFSDTVRNMITGSILSILFVIIIEYVRQPKLKIEIDKPRYKKFEDQRPASEYRFLRLKLRNVLLPWFFRWLNRSNALSCHGTITFYTEDFKSIFDRPMQIRWVKSIEPLPIKGDWKGRIGINPTPDSNQLRLISGDFEFIDPRLQEINRDISPGEEELFDVAARFDNDNECYGWSNENYMFGWRNPHRKLEQGKFLIKGLIYSSGKKLEEVFKIINFGPPSEFRLVKASKEEKRKLLRYSSDSF